MPPQGRIMLPEGLNVAIRQIIWPWKFAPRIEWQFHKAVEFFASSKIEMHVTCPPKGNLAPPKAVDQNEVKISL